MLRRYQTFLDRMQEAASRADSEAWHRYTAAQHIDCWSRVRVRAKGKRRGWGKGIGMAPCVMKTARSICHYMEVQKKLNRGNLSWRREISLLASSMMKLRLVGCYFPNNTAQCPGEGILNLLNSSIFVVTSVRGPMFVRSRCFFTNVGIRIQE